VFKISDLKRKAIDKKRNLSLTLPIPLSVNHMYYNTYGGGKRLTKKAEDYVKIATSRIKAQVEKQGWKLLDDNTWYYVDMVFYFPDKRIRDSHNTLKILFDILQGQVFVNDYFAMPRVLSVELDADNPRVEIFIHNQTTKERIKALSV
jgi:crossover junction endodeoxyribonuclease RusA